MEPVSTSSPRATGRLRRPVAMACVLALVMVLAPSIAFAEGDAPPPETVTDEIERFALAEEVDGWQTSEVVAAPIAFTMIGFAGPEVATLEARVQSPEGWSEWYELPFMDDEDGPDEASAEGAQSSDPGQGRAFTEPLFVSEASHVQIRVSGAPLRDFRASVIDADGVSRSLFQRVRDSFRPSLTQAPAEAAAPSNIISRQQWGANEKLRRGNPSYARQVNYAVVHHTAHGPNANSYTRDQAFALMRSFYSYHTTTLGWSDIGYNIVIDRYGRIFEGRAGGLTSGVIGAHAGGFNTGSVGVALIGNFESVLPTAAARKSLVDVLAWQAGHHGFDPQGTVRVSSGGNARFPRGTNVNLRGVVGHRDTGWTACPGARFASTFNSLRSDVAAKVQAPFPRHSFPDVSSDRYFDVPVSWLAHHGITDGFGDTGTFAPGAAVTRGQMASFIWRLAGKPTGHPNHGFPDVPSNAHYADAVRWMKATGITDGYGTTGRFEPNRSVTRGEMATFLWRYAGEPTGHPDHRFPDVGERHYTEAVRWMRAHGLTNGFGDTGEYRPSRSITRGEMAAMLYRLSSTPTAWKSAPSVTPYATFYLG
ncbi:MAG: S-layer homology domain-containing protein [Nitriliruptoraceae bacterium]|nr:S-layer homology domain-containing protein [Nitriliruptoraceae bacterium]